MSSKGIRLKTRVKKSKKYSVTWGHDSYSDDLWKTVLSVVNDLLLDKGLEIKSSSDEVRNSDIKNPEYDYKITLELDGLTGVEDDWVYIYTSCAVFSSSGNMV